MRLVERGMACVLCTHLVYTRDIHYLNILIVKYILEINFTSHILKILFSNYPNEVKRGFGENKKRFQEILVLVMEGQ